MLHPLVPVLRFLQCTAPSPPGQKRARSLAVATRTRCCRWRTRRLTEPRFVSTFPRRWLRGARGSCSCTGEAGSSAVWVSTQGRGAAGSSAVWVSTQGRGPAGSSAVWVSTQGRGAAGSSAVWVSTQGRGAAGSSAVWVSTQGRVRVQSGGNLPGLTSTKQFDSLALVYSDISFDVCLCDVD